MSPGLMRKPPVDVAASQTITSPLTMLLPKSSPVVGSRSSSSLPSVEPAPSVNIPRACRGAEPSQKPVPSRAML